MDLLVYLVRKQEVDVLDVPLATIVEQYLAYLETLEQLNVDNVGEFLALASTLVEIKSRLALPRAGEEEPEDEPREDLVRHLLQYKKYRDAAALLDERLRQAQQRHPRLADDLPPRERNLADEPIHELELWDLVTAVSRLTRDRQEPQVQKLVYDETPIESYMKQIHEVLVREGRVSFSQLFQPGMHKSTLVGMFLAVLELVRHYGVRTEQSALFGEIDLLPGSAGDGESNPNFAYESAEA
jgi:segregation and condensation protein A